MKSKFLFFISLIVLFVQSCTTVKFVPDYSETIMKQLIDTQKLNEKLYTNLLAEPLDKRTYQSREKEYLEIESDINSILFQNQSREKNVDFVKMTKLLKENFMQFKDEHKSKRTISDGEIKVYISTINGFYQPLLTAETALLKTKKN